MRGFVATGEDEVAAHGLDDPGFLAVQQVDASLSRDIAGRGEAREADEEPRSVGRLGGLAACSTTLWVIGFTPPIRVVLQ